MSAYCHFHPLIFDLPENTTLYTETTLKTAFAVLSRNQSPDVSNLQRGRSCEWIFDSSPTFFNPLVRKKSLYGKKTVRFFFFFFLSPHLPYVFGHVRLTRLLLRCSYPTLNQFWEKNPTVLQSKIRATLAITELYATNEIMIKKHVLFLTWLVRDDNYLSW